MFTIKHFRAYFSKYCWNVYYNNEYIGLVYWSETSEIYTFTSHIDYNYNLPTFDNDGIRDRVRELCSADMLEIYLELES